MAINKFVRERKHGFVCNQNDILHGIKSGPRYKEGKTWSEKLYDKPEPGATHFYWAIRHCEGDGNTLSHA